MTTTQTVTISDDGKIIIGKPTPMPGNAINEKHLNKMMNNRLADEGYGDKPKSEKPGPCCNHK